MSPPLYTQTVAAAGLLAGSWASRVAQAPPDSAASRPTLRVGGYIQARETYRASTNLTATLNRVRITADGYCTRRGADMQRLAYRDFDQ